MITCQRDGCTAVALHTVGAEQVCSRHLPNARLRARRTARAGQLRPCGTHAAYNRHLRDREVPCAPCSAAEATYQQQRRKARAA